MSGGGGGGGGDPDPPVSPCDRLRFEAQLSSPQPAVVATIQVGDILQIVVATLKGTLVVQVLKDGQPAGGLTGPQAAQLRNCIDQGHNYQATVRIVNGGQVRVIVEHI